MKVLLDTNVLYDVLAARPEFVAPATAIWAAAEAKHFEGFVSAISFATLFYLGRRTVGTELAMEGIRKVRRVFEIAPVDDEVITRAIGSGMSDFEDAIQVFSAIKVGAMQIVTRDQTGFSQSPLPTLSPQAFVGSLIKT